MVNILFFSSLSFSFISGSDLLPTFPILAVFLLQLLQHSYKSKTVIIITLKDFNDTVTNATCLKAV